jgi:DNA-binding MarR family transcriptional regulator
MTQRRRRSAQSPPRSSDPGDAGFRIEHYPFYRMARLGALYDGCLEAALKPRGLDQPRWRVLMILNEHHPAAMGLISKLAVMKLPTAVKLIQRMAEQGLVRTAPLASDQRVNVVSITAKGRGALKIVKQVASGVYRAAVAEFSAADIERCRDLLARAESNLDGFRRKPGAQRLASRRLVGLKSKAGPD